MTMVWNSASLDTSSPLVWLFVGDSITQGGHNTLGHRDYTQHFAEYVRYEMRRMRDVVINMGFGGHTTRDFLADFQWRVAQFRPSITFIMLGMNDAADNRQLSPAEFEINLKRLCRQTLDLNSQVILQTPCPIVPDENTIRPNLPHYMDRVRQVANDENLPLVDHYRQWESRAAAKDDPISTLLNDAIHPNHLGHRLMASYLLQQLGIWDEAKFLCGLLESANPPA